MGRLTMRGAFDGQDGIFILNEYGGSTFYAPYEENYHALERLALYEDAAEAAMQPQKETEGRQEDEQQG